MTILITVSGRSEVEQVDILRFRENKTHNSDPTVDVTLLCMMDIENK